MKKLLSVSTSIDQPGLLQNLVEKLATRHISYPPLHRRITNDLRTVETASTETFMAGTLSLNEAADEGDQVARIPFITQFLFTCVQENEDSYRLTWCSSLS